MLQPFTKQEDIPEALREHYSKREDGQWHADIPDTHPAVKHNAKLLSEKNTAEGKVAQLTSDVESARAGNLGRGQVAVAKSDLALLDEYKALGTPAEIKPKLDEHKSLSEESIQRKRTDSLRQMSKDLGFNDEAFVRLPNLPEFERRDKDGKPEWVAKVKGDNNTITEKPAKEFIESSQDIAPFMASLKVESKQVELPGGQISTQPSSGEPFAWAKNYAQNYIKTAQPAADWTTAYGKPTV